MAICRDPEGLEALKKIVGRRLKASRKAAGVTEADAAEKLGHTGITQVSLAESGDRLPPPLDMVKYADLYCVPLDFLYGRIDDPIAEPEEHGQGLIVRSVAQTIQGVFETFARAVSEHTAVTVAGHREDRTDLREILAASEDALGAFKRFKELNPEFEEDCRGSAKLETAIMRMLMIASRVKERIERDRRQIEVIDKALKLERIGDNVQQFALQLHR